MNTSTLQSKYDELCRRSINLRSFEGTLSDVAFEIATADTHIAGVAASLLEGATLQAVHRAILTLNYLAGQSWVLSDGRQVDLGSTPELLVHAQLLEQVRSECLRYVES